ncbi:BREX-1 system phosphatase PglZ type B, partial [Thiocapsa sp.]|uniref:BREX-1 system phosphatase PglZ type B n=1 Tax=Thiocapsa sp. TaxID=2024551 RepID=UPI002C05EB81
TRLKQLCAQHAPRADSLWADLGEAPLARATVQLKTLAEWISAGVGGHDWDALTAAYLDRGWTIDAAAWRAYATVRDARDLDAVTAALRAVYLPWLVGLAEQVQGWGLSYPAANPAQSPSFEPTPGTVLVFVDGLRCDLGLELARLLRADGLTVESTTRWAALPTVTATAKPAWRPLADALIGNSLPEGFEPQDTGTGKNLTTQAFRNLLASHGLSWLEAASTGDPAGAAWTEIGTFDHDGHAQGARLAWRLDEELRAVALRVRDLLAAGWQRAVLITDHGWLLLPGGLPKVDLPAHLTQSRWPRCAVPQPGAQHGFPELPWFWGGGHSVVYAPGISAFKRGIEYTHGGLSLQEALTLTLTVTADGKGAHSAVAILSTDWKGLRLRVQLQGGFAGTLLDIRTRPADAASSVLDSDRRMQPPDADGAAALLVTDDQHEGAAAVLVVLRAGQVVAKQPVTIGGD